ncbi:MAG: uroporphyrinogen decarboxylase family protein [Anaerovoracaceae bacterium]
MKRNMKEWQAQAVASERKKPFPILSYPAIQDMKISLESLVKSGDHMSRAMEIISEKTDMMAAIGFMDLSVEAEAFGCEVKYFEGEVPTVKGVLVTNQQDAENLSVPEVGKGRTGEFLYGIEKAVNIIHHRPTFAGMIGPFSLAGRLLDVNKAMIYCKKNPEILESVLEKATSFLVMYAKEFKRLGANGVFIAEPLAGLLSPVLAQKFSEPYIRSIVEQVQDQEFLVYYHNCGPSAGKMAESLVTTGCAGYHFGNAVDLSSVVGLIPESILVMGNIDPATKFVNGTPEDMKEAVQTLLYRYGTRKNFIPSSGCDIPHTAPWENIETFFQEVKKTYELYGKQ